MSSVEIFYDSYNRDKYHATGASMYVQTALTEYNRFLPEREYHWQFYWFYPSGRQRTSYFTYKPSLDCIVNDTTYEAYCGVSATEVGTIKTFEVVTAVDQKCIAEEQEYIMAAMMDASVDVEWSYKPTPFRVGKPSIVLSKDEIHPKIRPGYTLNQEAIAAGTATMTATTLDAYGCEVPIPEVRVSVKNVLPEDSAGHYHVQEGSEGAGEYVTVKNGTHKMESDTAFTAVSDQSGKVVAEYQAGSLGVAENVMVTAYNRTNNDWPFVDNEELQTASAELAIKVPGLVHLDRGETTYALQGLGSVLDLLHNRSAFRRNSHWVTPYVYAKAQQLSDVWSTVDPDGLPLCYNDGSLEFGGTFDDPNDTSDYRAHYYHQVGKDVDVNRYGCVGYAKFMSVDGDAKLPIYMMYDGNKRTKKYVLERLAESMDGQPYPVGTIHVRCH